MKALRREKLAEARRLQRAGGVEAAPAAAAAVSALPVASSSPAVTASKSKAVKPTVLQRAQAQLAGGRFRWLNEELYSREGSASLALMAEQPQLFEE